jgi:hypothetical protein
MKPDSAFTREIARLAFSELLMIGKTMGELLEAIHGARRILIEAAADPRIDPDLLRRYRAGFEAGIAVLNIPKTGERLQ